MRLRNGRPTEILLKRSTFVCLRSLLGGILLLFAFADRVNAQFRVSQQEASAASDMIVQGVQQGITSLPPTSGQSFIYDYNAELGTFEASTALGPTVLRAPQTIGKGRLSVRSAVSYFQLGETFDPLIYEINIPAGQGIPTPLYTKFGMSAQANVILFNLGGTYGITDRIEVSLNIPISVVQAQARQLYTVRPQNLSLPPSERPLGVVVPAPGQSPQQALDAAFATNQLVIADNTFNALGFDFIDGHQAGVGRISVGGKALLYTDETVDLAFSTEFFCNSPNEAQFAGSNSPSILPRLIGEAKLASHLNYHADLGYEWDMVNTNLTRLTWNTGFSIPVVNATFDVGVGGSKFDTPIRWTPVRSKGTGPATPDYPDGIPAQLRLYQAHGDNKLGTNFVDVLVGMKVKLWQGLVLSGGVNVPVTEDGFRADAVGTGALEYYF